MKKKNKGNNSAMLALIAIVAIVAIVFLVTRSQENKFRPDIAVSIDTEGNVYDGNNNYVGKLADPDIRFYDEDGNLLGQATFSFGNNLVGDMKKSGAIGPVDR